MFFNVFTTVRFHIYRYCGSLVRGKSGELLYPGGVGAGR